jgi:ABC-type polysaccharide transport system permease subunit
MRLNYEAPAQVVVKKPVVVRAQKTPWYSGLKKHWPLYAILLPALLSIILFNYGPMLGAAIAFLDYSPVRGIAGSQFVGLKNFTTAFNNPFFLPALRNTIVINVGKLAVGFPSAIILALLLNEVRLRWFKSTVQTATMLPYFISWIVAAAMFRSLLAPEGVVNQILHIFGINTVFFLTDPNVFPWVIILQDTWKYVGYFAVIYLAAMAAIDPVLYEAAQVDGANRWKQITHITLPSIRPTMITLFVVLVGYLIQGGFEQVFAMYSVAVYSTSDILETFTFRLGLQQSRYGLATAVGLFQGIISVALVLFTNWLVTRYNRQDQDQKGLF